MLENYNLNLTVKKFIKFFYLQNFKSFALIIQKVDQVHFKQELEEILTLKENQVVQIKALDLYPFSN